MPTASIVDPVLARAEREGAEYESVLCDLCRVPGVSAAGHPRDAMVDSARAVAAAVERFGLPARIVTPEGAHPFVLGEWLGRADAPTLLLYAHHDVQPIGRADHWISPPYAPETRGGRLYARGAADDKGGLVALLASLAAWLRETGSLPCNVRLLMDGEEEIGSPHLEPLLDAHRDVADADAVAVLDTPNLAAGRPALTSSLRGGCVIDVEVRVLERPLHSGRGAGVVPDPLQVLFRVIGRLADRNGALRLPGLPPASAWLRPRDRRRIRAVPFSMDGFRADVGLLDGVGLTGPPGQPVNERLWARPSVTVIGVDAPAIAGSSNQIVEGARARLSLRTAPTMDAADVARRAVEALVADPPHGAHVTARALRSLRGWRAEAEGPVFAAARAALASGYGVAPVEIGTGGSIGFVETFARRLPGVPCVLFGLEDPACNAHSEDESLHLGDWRAAIRSTIHFLDAFARTGKRRAS